MIYFMLFLIVMLHIFKQIGGEVQYYISQDKSTWINASRMCTLGTPSVNLNNLSLDVPNQEITEDLWIGYHLVSVKFELIGCVCKSYGFELSSYNGKSLSECFSSCYNAPYFGLSNTTCFCFNKKPHNISQDFVCGKQCIRLSCNPCKGDGYMTIFKLYSDDYKNNSPNITESNSLYTWYSSICPPKSNPTIITYGKHFVQTAFAVVRFDEFSAGTTTRIPGFGFIGANSSSDQKILRFKKPSDKLRALCVRETEHNTHEEDDSSVYIVVFVVVPVCVITLVLVFVILKRRKMVPTSCIKSETIRKDDVTNQRFASRDGIEKDTNVSNEMFSKNVDTVDEVYSASHYSSIEDDPNCTNHQSSESAIKNNSIVAKFSNNEPSRDKLDQHVEDGNIENRHYFVLEKVEGVTADKELNDDIIGIKNISTVIENEGGVYNTVNETEKETSDNVYDTTDRKPNKHDKTYDTTENTSSRRRESVVNCLDYYSLDDVDFEYSHISKKQMKYFKTDNVYGMQGQPGMHAQNVDKGGQYDAETYSHLNMKVTNKTDNVYGYNKV